MYTPNSLLGLQLQTGGTLEESQSEEEEEIIMCIRLKVHVPCDCIYSLSGLAKNRSHV